MGFAALNYEGATMKWSGMMTTMKRKDVPCCKGRRPKQEDLGQVIARTDKQMVTQEAMSRLLNTLDCDYCKVHLRQVISKAAQLSSHDSYMKEIVTQLNIKSWRSSTSTPLGCD
jgi:hypothetical protein